MEADRGKLVERSTYLLCVLFAGSGKHKTPAAAIKQRDATGVRAR